MTDLDQPQKRVTGPWKEYDKLLISPHCAVSLEKRTVYEVVLQRKYLIYFCLTGINKITFSRDTFLSC